MAVEDPSQKNKFGNSDIYPYIYTMNNILTFVIILLFLGWLLGVFVFSLGSFIHILLIIAVIALILRVLRV